MSDINEVIERLKQFYVWLDNLSGSDPYGYDRNVRFRDDNLALIAEVEAGRAVKGLIADIHHKILHILEYVDYEGEVADDLIEIRNKIDSSKALLNDTPESEEDKP